MSDLCITRDDFVEIAFTVKQAGGVYDGTNVQKIYFYIKTGFDVADGAATVTKTLANGGIAWVDAALGTGKITLAGTELAAIIESTAQPLVHTLKIIDANGKPRTLDKGKVYVDLTAVKTLT